MYNQSSKKCIAVFVCLLLVCGIPVGVQAESDVPAKEQPQAEQTTKLERTKALVEAAQSGQGVIQASETPEASELSLMKVFQGLALCIGAFLIFIWGLKKLNGGAAQTGNRRLTVLEKIPVAPKTSLLLVRVDQRDVLIGVGAENVSFLSDAGTKLRPKNDEQIFFSDIVEGIESQEERCQ